jgi:hypothetical protein
VLCECVLTAADGKKLDAAKKFCSEGKVFVVVVAAVVYAFSILCERNSVPFSQKALIKSNEFLLCPSN